MSDFGPFYDMPVCPFCGASQDDVHELDLANDGDKATVDCDCGKTYEVAMSIETTYATRDPIWVCEKCKWPRPPEHRNVCGCGLQLCSQCVGSDEHIGCPNTNEGDGS